MFMLHDRFWNQVPWFEGKSSRSNNNKEQRFSLTMSGNGMTPMTMCGGGANW